MKPYCKMEICIFVKGQLISKADWRAIDSPKKQMDKFVLFAFLLFTANKSNSSVCILGESTARQSAFRFYLTFKGFLYFKEDMGQNPGTPKNGEIIFQTHFYFLCDNQRMKK